MKLLLATGNRGKILEIKQILKDYPVELVTMAELGITISPEENGATFEENALIKARELCRASSMAALADDSGLCVDALLGEPGIYSARYSGEGATDEKNTHLLLTKLKGVERKNRQAHFCCVSAVVFPDGKEVTAQGTCEGIITDEPVGENGFGYDPVFLVPSLDLTFAQIPEEIKNQISHRANSLRILMDKLEMDKKVTQ
jgi:XTP/dITP diphosphohydrolase